MKILVVCASNICRSPYVEYLLKREVENDKTLQEKIEWIKSSAVFNKSKKIHPKAKIALQDVGFEDEYIDSHQPTYIWFNYSRFAQADLIIGMTKAQKYLLPPWLYSKFKTLSELANGSYTKIPDPFLAKTQEEYNVVMQQLQDYVKKYSENLKQQLKE